jgi:hypothetical protein
VLAFCYDIGYAKGGIMAQLELKEVKIEILQVLEVIRDPQEFDRTDATAKYILNLAYEIDNLGVRQLKISTRD